MGVDSSTAGLGSYTKQEISVSWSTSPSGMFVTIFWTCYRKPGIGVAVCLSSGRFLNFRTVMSFFFQGRLAEPPAVPSAQAF